MELFLISKGIEVNTGFFDASLAKELARKGAKADLLIGNNIFAHVPDINDFVEGLKIVLNHDGVITLELIFGMKRSLLNAIRCLSR